MQIRTVGGLEAAVEAVTQIHQTDDLWYRGHARSERWKLVPSIFRSGDVQGPPCASVAGYTE